MFALGNDAGAFRCRHSLRNCHFAGFFDVARMLVFLEGLKGNESKFSADSRRTAYFSNVPTDVKRTVGIGGEETAESGWNVVFGRKNAVCGAVLQRCELSGCSSMMAKQTEDTGQGAAISRRERT